MMGSREACGALLLYGAYPAAGEACGSLPGACQLGIPRWEHSQGAVSNAAGACMTDLVRQIDPATPSHRAPIAYGRLAKSCEPRSWRPHGGGIRTRWGGGVARRHWGLKTNGWALNACWHAASVAHKGNLTTSSSALAGPFWHYFHEQWGTVLGIHAHPCAAGTDDACDAGAAAGTAPRGGSIRHHQSAVPRGHLPPGVS